MEKKIGLIKEWIESSEEKTSEKEAFGLTIDAYNELGLWTWGNDQKYKNNDAEESN